MAAACVLPYALKLGKENEEVCVYHLSVHCNGCTDPPVSAATMCMLPSVVIYIRTYACCPAGNAVSIEYLYMSCDQSPAKYTSSNWSLCSVVLCGQRLNSSKVANICHHYTITQLCDETSTLHVALLEYAESPI